MGRSLILLVLCGVATWITPAAARDWTDAGGRVVVRGEAFAVNPHTVVIQRPNGELIGLRISDLSAADQAFLKEHQAELVPEPQPAPEPDQPPPNQPDIQPAPRPVPATPPPGQLWTSRDGHQIRGRAIGFSKDQITIGRAGRLINVNGVAYSNLDPVAKYVVLQVVAEFDDPTVRTERDLNEWVRRQGGQPRTFPVEGVVLSLADGKKVTVPFFLFSDQDLSALRPGWEQWKHEQATDTEKERENFLMSVQAQQYQLEREKARQIQMMQLELLATTTGLTTVWEVYLMPAPGVYARPLSVVVSARTSAQAQQIAMSRYPGYVPGPARALTP